jgi:hypothetical protein
MLITAGASMNIPLAIVIAERQGYTHIVNLLHTYHYHLYVDGGVGQ